MTLKGFLRWFLRKDFSRRFLQEKKTSKKNSFANVSSIQYKFALKGIALEIFPRGILLIFSSDKRYSSKRDHSKVPAKGFPLDIFHSRTCMPKRNSFGDASKRNSFGSSCKKNPYKDSSKRSLFENKYSVLYI